MGHAPPQRVNALVRAVRFTPGVPYLATGSEPAQPRRAAALCSDFRACKRDPPPSPSHLLYVWGPPSLRCGASSTFIPSLLQRHGRKKVGSLRSAIGLLAADVGTTWVAREGAQQGARHHNA